MEPEKRTMMNTIYGMDVQLMYGKLKERSVHNNAKAMGLGWCMSAGLSDACIWNSRIRGTRFEFRT